MNQAAPDMYYPQHPSAGQAPPPQTASVSHYPQHQPPLLQPGPAQYSTASPYNQYYATNGLTSPPTGPPSVSNPMSNAQNVLPLPGVNPQPTQMHNQFQGFDTTGQQPPPGMKPRVTATLWEDEGSLCFQVEARGICVARREDNHMINGTKLLNVAGMTRGRRDGILKSEKVRHVVKIGPMHLKGVWIPYDRALDFANKEKITELLYPLFVHNIGALLYHPTNQHRTSQVMAAAERRKHEQSQMRPGPPGLPSINHHQMAMHGSQPPLPSHNNMTRPGLDRAHTFPTPPTGTTIANMASSDGFGNNWHGQGMNGAQGQNPISIDTGMNTARSMPNTPATTPPGTSLQGMQQYPPSSQTYDHSRQLYHTSQSQQSPYQGSSNVPQDRMYAQPNSYAKHEMGPPSGRPSVSGPSGDHQQDGKPINGMMHSDNSSQTQGADDEQDHEQHETEYTHDSGTYDAARAPYNYTAPGVGALTNENNLSPEMAGSPNHPPGSGRATPRTTAPPQPYYSHHQGFNTPPRVQQSSSNLYNVMSHDRGSTNGASGNDVYAPASDMPGSMGNSYGSAPSVMNGAPGPLKRGRDDGEDISRSANDGPTNLADMKRRKTMIEAPIPAPVYDAMTRPASAITAPARR